MDEHNSGSALPDAHEDGFLAPHERLAALVGEWEGTALTWFEPDVLADESPWRGSIRLALDGHFAIHEYTGTLMGNPLTGMAIIGYSLLARRYEMAWIDNQHNGSSIMFCVGDQGRDVLSVLGSYPDPTGGPNWGWRTTIETGDADTLTITAYNITPSGEEAKAIETIYRRMT